MRQMLLGMFLTGVLCFLISGCSATPAPSEKTPVDIQKLMEGGPVHIQLAKEKTIQVVLDGNATTGYTWHVINTTPELVSVSKERYITLDPGLCGAPGKYSWTVKALAPGKAKLLFRYYRNWEGFDPEKDREQIYLVDVLNE